MGTRRRSAILLPLLAAAIATATPAVAGIGGTGDPFFPKAGNEGYDVSNYELVIDYTPDSNLLIGAARIEATATSALERFNLDLRKPLAVSSVLVDGVPAASFRQSSQELTIRPAAPIAAGAVFSVDVAYEGKPEAVIDPDGSSEGWIRTDDGAFVASEPQGSPSWFPANDTPTDKASFTISITVPEGIVGLGNGVLQSRSVAGGKETFVWRQAEPMAPYLATAASGRFNLKISEVEGLPYYAAIDPRAGNPGPGLRQTPEMMRYLIERFGPYPFSSLGAIVDHEPGVFYALETQAIPIYPGPPGEATVVHELAHQWFGNAVTLKRWPDIWLHEGIATWVEWDWSEHSGGSSRKQIYRELYSTPARVKQLWNPAPNALRNPAQLFSASTYQRGALTIEALAQRIGERKVVQILRRLYAEHRYGNISSGTFTDLAEEVSGKNLGRFFADWLLERGKPKGYGVG